MLARTTLPAVTAGPTDVTFQKVLQEAKMAPHNSRRLVVGVVLVGAAAACSGQQSTQPDGNTQSKANTDAGAAVPGPPLGLQDSGSPSDGAVRMRGIILVNASLRFPAFRLCKGDGESGTLSDSSEQPFPVTRMPSSSLAGVDISGAVRIDPLRYMDTDSSAILFPIDNETKTKPELESGSCRALVCGTTTGGSCLPSAKLRRVTAYRSGVPAKSAFSEGGHLLVLRDGPGSGEVRFEVVDPGVEGGIANGTLRVAYHNFSTYTGPLLFTGGGKSFEVSKGTPINLPLAFGAWGTSELKAGTLTSSFVDIHAVSEPSVSLADYYQTPSLFALLLLGDTRPDSGAEPRPLKLLAIPVTPPGIPPRPGTDDAGPSDAGTPDASSDAGSDAPPG